MAMPQSIAPSLTELARLSDEIWFLAGDTSVDYSWYTKRATLSAVYSSTELFMTTDSSPNYNETENFLDRRLSELQGATGLIGASMNWISFSALAAINVARSKGLRI
jgi:ubiquinone biosynthesis protein COQ9